MSYDLSRAQYRAAIYGYTIVQRTSFPDAPNTAGWCDHTGGDGRPPKTCYVFTDRLLIFSTTLRPHVARKVAMHEVGHARWKARTRLTPDMVGFWRYVRALVTTDPQAVEEDFGEAYSHINDNQAPAGVGYAFRSPSPDSDDWTRLKAAL